MTQFLSVFFHVFFRHFNQGSLVLVALLHFEALHQQHFPSSRKNMHDVTSSLKQVDSMKSLPSQKRHKAHYTIFYYLNWRHFTTDSDDDDDDDDCKTQLNCLSLCTDNLPVAQQLYHELHF